MNNFSKKRIYKNKKKSKIKKKGGSYGEIANNTKMKITVDHLLGAKEFDKFTKANPFYIRQTNEVRNKIKEKAYQINHILKKLSNILEKIRNINPDSIVEFLYLHSYFFKFLYPNREIPEIFNELNSDNFYIIGDINSSIQSESLKYINKNINTNFSDKLNIAKNIFLEIDTNNSKTFSTIIRALSGKRKHILLPMFDEIGVHWEYVKDNLKKHYNKPISLDDFISAFGFKSSMNHKINKHTNYSIDIFNIIGMFIDNIKKELKNKSMKIFKEPYTEDKFNIIIRFLVYLKDDFYIELLRNQIIDDETYKFFEESFNNLIRKIQKDHL